MDAPGDSDADAQAREDDLQAGLSGLRAGLGDLSGVAAGALPLDQLLARVAGSAVRAIPQADGAGAIVLRPDTAGEVQAFGASDALVSQIDVIQYELCDEGPCITAALEGETVRSGSLSGDRRWPRFGPQAGGLGVHSVLSLPLMLPDSTVIGAINVYSRTKDAFDDEAARLGELFAATAGVAVHNAQLLTFAQQRRARLHQALESRAIIAQAIGIVRSRSGGSEQEGFDRLRSISESDNVGLAVAAERIVDEAVSRAHARHDRS